MEKLSGDKRVFGLGGFLRRTCMDELPQLLNVLRGEMSLVGPRPCLPYEAEAYARWHSRRFDMVPGMTGLWQVSGKNRCSFPEMVRLDVAYARALSPWLDMKILLKTPLTVLAGMLPGFGGAEGDQR
jgi:lipopolysaccharide/colanic/teichoic acid biosynthesis glycosyltransferase